MNSFYSEDELKRIGFKRFGENVLISRKASMYSPEKMIIGNNVRIDDFCILSGEISLGSHIHIAAFCGLWGAKGIVLEDFANLSSRISIYSITDDFSGETMTNPTIPDLYKKIRSGKVVIKKHSLIGSTSVVLPGIEIGEGCSFGAFSFINKSTDPWGIYAGIPIKRIKERKKDLLRLENRFLKEFNEKQKGGL